MCIREIYTFDMGLYIMLKIAGKCMAATGHLFMILHQDVIRRYGF